MICVATLTTGRWKQNCYVLSHADHSAIVIDPGEDAEEIMRYVREANLNVAGVVNTHAHYDHVGAVENFRESFSAQFYLHSGDEKLLTQANFYQTIFGGSRKIRIPKIDVDLAENHEFSIGKFGISVLHTPGHTEGSVSILIDKMLFTGDLILFGKIGRSDLPGGNKSKLQASVESVLNLPDDMILFPGHGQPTLLKDIRTKLRSTESATAESQI